MISSQTIDKIKGCLYGQAVGDALGLGAEFLTKAQVSKFYPNGVSKYEDIVQDRHRKRWIKGSWTDDTDMMLCILDAFDGREFNIRKVAKISRTGLTENLWVLGSYAESPYYERLH